MQHLVIHRYQVSIQVLKVILIFIIMLVQIQCGGVEKDIFQKTYLHSISYGPNCTHLHHQIVFFPYQCQRQITLQP